MNFPKTSSTNSSRSPIPKTSSSTHRKKSLPSTIFIPKIHSPKPSSSLLPTYTESAELYGIASPSYFSLKSERLSSYERNLKLLNMTDRRNLALSHENFIQKKDLEWMEKLRSKSNEQKIIIPHLIKEKIKCKIELGKGKYGYFRLNVPLKCELLKFFVNSWKGTCVIYISKKEIPNENKFDWSFGANNFNLLFKSAPSSLYLTLFSIADFRGDISFECLFAKKAMQSALLHSNEISDPEEPTFRGGEGWEEGRSGRKMIRRRNFVKENWLLQTKLKRDDSEKRQEEERKKGKVEFWREIMEIKMYFAKRIDFMKRDTRKEEVFSHIYFNLK